MEGPSSVTCNFRKVNVPEFDKVYDVCDCGQHVYNRNIKKYLTIRKDGCGYLETNMSYTVNGNITKKKFKMHYLVTKTFINDFDEEKHNIVHKDDNTENNNLTNLNIVIKEYEPEEEITCEFKRLVCPKHPNLQQYYEVCNCGQHIRSLRSGKILSQYLRPDGYYEVRLVDHKTGLGKNIPVAHAVAHTYHDNSDPTKTLIDHINRITKDNRAENLRFLTPKENMANKTDDNSRVKKPILKISLDGKLIYEYENITEIINEHDTHYTFEIYKNLREEVTNAHGYVWKYKNESDKLQKYIAKEDEIIKTIGTIKIFNKESRVWETLNYPNYKVSNFGVVINKDGYKTGNQSNPRSVWQVVLTHNNVRRTIGVHTLVAYMFVGLPTDYDPVKHEIQFKDGDLTNPCAYNLQWVTHKERHADIRGRKVKATSKDGKVHEFDSITDGMKFLQELHNNKKSNYTRSIKSCLNGYQESAYGFRWEEV